jgi:hypothetical protein
MKKVAIVAAHFVPSNLTSVHRSRLWSLHLKEFGWEPIIVTTHWKYYEEKPEWELQELVPNDLRIIRTRAIPAKPLRLIGDVGVRSFYWHYKTLNTLAREDEIDFILITIPSNYSALLGRLIWKKFKIPYGIDYIDPWVHEWPGVEKVLSKAWFSHRLGKMLEPWAVKHCKLITGVADGYYKEVFERNPSLSSVAHKASMPYGISNHDFDLVKKKRRNAFLFDKFWESFNIVYAGAMLPHSISVWEQLFKGIKILVDKFLEESGNVHFHLIGTGKKPNDPHGHNIEPIAKQYGVEKYISECPQRVPYIDTLNHLLHSSAVLIVGSDRPHYSPSKVYQAIIAEKPIFALLCEESSAVRIIRSCKAGNVVDFKDPESIDPKELAHEMMGFINHYRGSSYTPDLANFEPYTARHSAQSLANAMNGVD